MSKKRDFLKLADLTVAEHEKLFNRAAVLKAERAAGKTHNTLAGRTLTIILEKNSTRTRLSFEAGMYQLGGHAVTLASESQISRGEPVTDTARVAGAYSDIIVYRTSGDDRIQAMAKMARVPVINGLSDIAHPVQLLADLFTMRERLGQIQGKTVAWVGDGSSNMALSWIEAAKLFDFELRIASPDRFAPSARDIETIGAGAKVRVSSDPKEAVRGADVINTDVWTSMGFEAESADRLRAFKGFIVDSALMSLAKPSAIVLHCLPAHRGEEISADVLEGPQTAVWDEAENRLHTQKALLELLLLG